MIVVAVLYIHICFCKLYFNGSQSVLTASVPRSALVLIRMCLCCCFCIESIAAVTNKILTFVFKIVASYNITSEILIIYFITASFK
jgi:hypothetical protein